MSNWRPENWHTMVKSPYMHDGVKMAKESPERALELELQHQAFRGGQEAGADAMLVAISEEIEKGLLTDEEINDEWAVGAGRTMEADFRAIAKAQLDKILALFNSK